MELWLLLRMHNQLQDLAFLQEPSVAKHLIAAEKHSIG